MKINYQSDNPFTRQRLLHPTKPLYTSTATVNKNQRLQDNYIYQSRAQHYPLNIWNFRDDHNNSFMRLSQCRNLTQISSFQKSIMINNANSKKPASSSSSSSTYTSYSTYTPYNNNKTDRKYLKLDENPFKRKNLLITRQQIQQEIQKDRNRINYQQWSDGNQNNWKNSRRQSSYGNPQDKYNYTVNQISNNGSMMMNLLDRQSLEGHLLATLGSNLLTRGVSSRQRQSLSNQKREKIEKVQRVQKIYRNQVKQHITVRNKKYFRTDVINMTSRT